MVDLKQPSFKCGNKLISRPGIKYFQEPIKILCFEALALGNVYEIEFEDGRREREYCSVIDGVYILRPMAYNNLWNQLNAV